MASDPLALLDGLIARAPDMRKAGIVSVKLDGLECLLAPADVEVPAGAVAKEEPTPSDPLSDPRTFGLQPGDRIPGFERPSFEGGDA